MPTQKPEDNPELRLRTMRTLWLALLMSIGGYFVLTLFVPRPEGLEPNSTLSVVFTAVAMAATFASVVVKSKLVSKAIELRQPAQVQQAYVVALAVNEVGALLGVIDYFKTSNPYYYVPFIIAAVGVLLNFPRREHVEAASVIPPAL